MIPFAIKILTSPAFSLVTLLLGFLIGHRLSIGRDERQEFNNAAAFFREAFLPEITFLKHNVNIGNLGSSGDLSELLRFGYVHRHLKAFEIFRNYLSTKERTSIDKAWQKYCHHPDNPENLYFDQYSEKDMKIIALERIEGILKFAKHK